MSLKTIATPNAPAAIGPYVQGVIAGGFLFTAGQIPLDPESGQMIAGGIEEQTERVLLNLAAVLQEAGANWSHVVKTTVYLQDLGHFPAMNEVYGRMIGDARPARSTVQVSALPKGALIEIDVVAQVPGA